MSERKVINKYYPPDFDPDKSPRHRGPRKRTVRLMAPFSMQCNECGEFIHKGTKFNARKETVKGEDYLTIRIYRFYIRCPLCAAEIAFKTDPKNADYIAEIGATRNHEPRKEQIALMEAARQKRQDEEEGNPIKALENKTCDLKREMNVLDGLGEIQRFNSRLYAVDPNRLFQELMAKPSDQDKVLDKLVSEHFSNKQSEPPASPPPPMLTKRTAPLDFGIVLED